jgi:hypothetical protein
VTLTIGIFVGAVLGLRFKVLILVPAMSFALVLVAVSGALRGENIWVVTVRMVLVVTSVQLGYLGGAILQRLMRTLTAKAKPGRIPRADRTA